MPDGSISYESAGIRASGSSSLEAAASAETVVAGLLAGVIGAADFGEVAGVDMAASRLAAARDGFARVGRQVRLGHEDLERRAQATAAAGDQLTVDTARVADTTGGGR